jgi:DNA-binding SARP family transcriptional activator
VDHLEIHLFGCFRIAFEGRPLAGFGCGKLQELFAILLLNPDRWIRRDWIAAQLWEDIGCSAPRKNLRHLFWRLQTALKETNGASDRLFETRGADWLACRPQSETWIDVSVLESACKLVCTSNGRLIPTELLPTVERAAERCSGVLLDGCNQQWCLVERERLSDIYMNVLDRLMDHCLVSGDYWTGIQHAHASLQRDPAREETFRRLMVLSALHGDRTRALRHFKRCTEVLEDEFDVRPSRATIALSEMIRNDRLTSCPPEDLYRVVSADRWVDGTSDRPAASTA